MNQRTWKYLRCHHKELLNFTYYNNARKLQKSLKYNSDSNAKIIHHLRDTEEQRKYNDEHYELWGFEIDEKGNEHFEYGKYVIFVTKEWHDNYHSQSEETRHKRSESMKRVWLSESFRTRELKYNSFFIKRSGKNHFMYGRHHSEETKRKISESEKGKVISPETREKISNSCKGNEPPNKGIPHSAETRNKISVNTRLAMTDEVRKKCSEAHKGLHHSDETRRKMSESAKSRVDDNFRNKMKNLQINKMSEEYKQHLGDEMRKIMAAKKALYKDYKESGGTMLWNDFQKYIKENNLLSFNK